MSHVVIDNESKWISKWKPLFLHLFGFILKSENCNKEKNTELVGSWRFIGAGISSLRLRIVFPSP